MVATATTVAHVKNAELMGVRITTGQPRYKWFANLTLKLFSLVMQGQVFVGDDRSVDSELKHQGEGNGRKQQPPRQRSSEQQAAPARLARTGHGALSRRGLAGRERGIRRFSNRAGKSAKMPEFRGPQGD